MKHIKLYENFNTSEIDLNQINKLINDKKFIRFMDTIPNWAKRKIQKYYKENGNNIEIDKMKKINKRYNIIEKVKKLYKKGITSFDEIYSRIIPKNESILGITVFILCLIFAAVGFWSLWDESKLSNPSNVPNSTPFIWVFSIVMIITSVIFLTLDLKNDRNKKYLSIMGYDVVNETTIDDIKTIYTIQDKETGELKVIDKDGFNQLLNQNDTIDFHNVEEFDLKSNESIDSYYDNKIKEWDKEFDDKFYYWLEQYGKDDFLRDEYEESGSNLPFEKWIKKYYAENVY